MPGVDAAAGTLAVPIWFAGAGAAPFVGAEQARSTPRSRGPIGMLGLGPKRAGSVALISSLSRVGLIAAVVLGAWLYVQQRALDDRKTALMEPASQSAPVIPPAEQGSVTSPPRELTPLRDPAAAEPASQSAAVIPPATLGSATSPPPPPAAAEPASQSAPVIPPAEQGSVASPPHEPPPLRDPAAAPASQSAAVTPPATLGSATSPPHEPPTAPSQEPSPGSVTPLPPRRPLQVRIATPPRAVRPPALLRRHEAP
jgi:hypothetical protein